MASPAWDTTGPQFVTSMVRGPQSVGRRLDSMNQLLWDLLRGVTPMTATEVFHQVEDFLFEESRRSWWGEGVDPEHLLDLLEAFADAAATRYAGEHGITSPTLTLNYLGLIRQLAFEHPHIGVSDRWRGDVERLSRSADDPDLSMDGLVVLMSYGGA